MTLISSIFKSIIIKREVKILFAFTLLPLLVPILSANVETITGDYTRSYLSFLQVALKTQYQLLLPILIFSLVISSVFRDEIDSRIMFLYKDINRVHIFNAKLLGLFIIHLLFTAVTSLFALISYYGILVPKFGVSPYLISSNSKIFQEDILILLGVFFINMITIVLVSMVSVKHKTIVTVLSGLLFDCVIMTAPFWIGLKVISPLSYMTILGNSSIFVKLCVMFALSFTYFIICYINGRKLFKKIEF